MHSKIYLKQHKRHSVFDERFDGNLVPGDGPSVAIGVLREAQSRCPKPCRGQYHIKLMYNYCQKYILTPRAQSPYPTKWMTNKGKGPVRNRAALPRVFKEKANQGWVSAADLIQKIWWRPQRFFLRFSCNPPFQEHGRSHWQRGLLRKLQRLLWR